jgi:PilZ domain
LQLEKRSASAHPLTEWPDMAETEWPDMAGEHRRRSQRHPVDVYVEYRFRSDAPWRNCRILDLSQHGATVRLQELEPGESFSERIDLEITSQPRDPIGIVLRGQIRRRSLQPEGLVIGIEFTPNDTGCIDLLRLLPRLHSTRGDVESAARELGFELEALTVDDVHVWAWRQDTEFAGPAFLSPQAATRWMDQRLEAGPLFDQAHGTA